MSTKVIHWALSWARWNHLTIFNAIIHLRLSLSRVCLGFIISLFHWALLLISHFHRIWTSYANIINSVTIKMLHKEWKYEALQFINFSPLFFLHHSLSSSAFWFRISPIYANLRISRYYTPFKWRHWNNARKISVRIRNLHPPNKCQIRWSSTIFTLSVLVKGVINCKVLFCTLQQAH
jgi:hypothetical protein